MGNYNPVDANSERERQNYVPHGIVIPLVIGKSAVNSSINNGSGKIKKLSPGNNPHIQSILQEL